LLVGLQEVAYGACEPCRVVDQDVHRPETLDDPVEQGVDVGTRRHVRTKAGRLPARRRDRRGRLRDGLLDVGERYASALRSKAFTDRTADVAGAAGDDGNAALETSA